MDEIWLFSGQISATWGGGGGGEKRRDGYVFRKYACASEIGLRILFPKVDLLFYSLIPRIFTHYSFKSFPIYASSIILYMFQIILKASSILTTQSIYITLLHLHKVSKKHDGFRIL